jgi:drug/metabolite transporter (DMT)-like permease
MKGAAQALGAAALFGMSAPVAKLLLPATEPIILASLLYLGAGMALVLVGAIGHVRPTDRRPSPQGREARVNRSDAAALAAVVVAGGMVGPYLMLVGLQHLSGTAASLLLNLEAPFTMILAVIAFREHLDPRALVGALTIVGGALLLAYRPGTFAGDRLGCAAIAGACVSWAIDNNLSQRLSLRDPAIIVRIKACRRHVHAAHWMDERSGCRPYRPPSRIPSAASPTD